MTNWVKTRVKDVLKKQIAKAERAADGKAKKRCYLKLIVPLSI